VGGLVLHVDDGQKVRDASLDRARVVWCGWSDRRVRGESPSRSCKFCRRWDGAC